MIRIEYSCDGQRRAVKVRDEAAAREFMREHSAVTSFTTREVPDESIVSVCAVCGLVLGVKSAEGAPGGFSHGIGPLCAENVFRACCRHWMLSSLMRPRVWRMRQ